VGYDSEVLFFVFSKISLWKRKSETVRCRDVTTSFLFAKVLGEVFALRGPWCLIIVLNIHALTEDRTDDVKGSFYEELERVFDKFPKYHMKILLGDVYAKVGSEVIFKSTIGNESLHEISNDNGVRFVNFATCKNLRVKSTMFPHPNIHKYTWTSPDGKTHNRIDHIPVDRRRHSNVLDVRSFRATD
jgi:hypothetical protein